MLNINIIIYIYVKDFLLKGNVASSSVTIRVALADIVRRY